jgi:hypothetical protein
VECHTKNEACGSDAGAGIGANVDGGLEPNWGNSCDRQPMGFWACWYPAFGIYHIHKVTTTTKAYLN